MNQIEEMDFLYYLELLAYDNEHEEDEWEHPNAYIDEI